MSYLQTADEAFLEGACLWKLIRENIEGSFKMTASDACILSWAVASGGDGDHLEIGTLFGGSAILAAKIKQRMGHRGKVVCVDPMIEHWGTFPTKDVLMGNAEAFGVELELITEYSHPWPLGDRQFVSVLVDGDHSLDACQRDWDNVKEHTGAKYVAFHDYDEAHPDVRQVVNEISHQKKRHGKMAVLLC